MIREEDLIHIAKYLEGDKNTKLGSKKATKRLENLDQKKQIDVYVNKIWDYLKSTDPSNLISYVEERAETIKSVKPEKELEEIYAEIVNDQK